MAPTRLFRERREALFARDTVPVSSIENSVDTSIIISQTYFVTTIFTDKIGLYSTTATYLASKEIEIGDKTQNKGCYAV